MARIDVDGIYKHSPMSEAQIASDKNDDREIVINIAQVAEAAPASSSDTDRTKYNPSYTCETGSGKVRRNIATLEVLGLDGSQATNSNLCGADLIGIDGTETYHIIQNATTVQGAIEELDSVMGGSGTDGQVLTTTQNGLEWKSGISTPSAFVEATNSTPLNLKGNDVLTTANVNIINTADGKFAVKADKGSQNTYLAVMELGTNGFNLTSPLYNTQNSSGPMSITSGATGYVHTDGTLTISSNSILTLESQSPITAQTSTGAPVSLITKTNGTENAHIKAQGTAIELKSVGDNTHYTTLTEDVTGLSVSVGGASSPLSFTMSGNNGMGTSGITVCAKNISLIAASVQTDTGTASVSVGGPLIGTLIFNTTGVQLDASTLPTSITTTELKLTSYNNAFDSTTTHKTLVYASSDGGVELAEMSDLTNEQFGLDSNTTSGTIFYVDQVADVVEPGDPQTYHPEVAKLSPGTVGQVLTIGSSGLEWANGGGGGMVNPMTTAGDMIIGGTSGAPSALAIGTVGQVLTVGSSGAPEWATAGGGSVSTSGGVQGDGTAGDPVTLKLDATGNVTLSQGVDGLKADYSADDEDAEYYSYPFTMSTHLLSRPTEMLIVPVHIDWAANIQSVKFYNGTLGGATTPYMIVLYHSVGDINTTGSTLEPFGYYYKSDSASDIVKGWNVKPLTFRGQNNTWDETEYLTNNGEEIFVGFWSRDSIGVPYIEGYADKAMGCEYTAWGSLPTLADVKTDLSVSSVYALAAHIHIILTSDAAS